MPGGQASDMARPRERQRSLPVVVLVVLLLLALAAICFFATWLTLRVGLATYAGRIYPNVYVLHVDLGGLTPDEAAVRLREAFADYDAGLLILTGGERRWSIPWAALGLELNVEATVGAAYSVGPDDMTPWTLARIVFGRQQVAPILVADPQAARTALEQLATEVSTPPTDATLRLEGDRLVAVPGQPGQALDVEATLSNLLALGSAVGGQEQLALTFQLTPPRVVDAAPAQAQAEELLSRGLDLFSIDTLTDETFTWTMERETIVTWLRVEPTEDGSGLVVRAAPEAIQTTVASLAVGLGEGRGFRLAEDAERVASALETGGGTVQLYLTHPERIYAVQSGDRLTTIAGQFGIPPGLIAEANPGVDLDWLHVGQELTIPSQDVVTPYTPVPGRLIVISIAEQRMRVYQDGGLLWDWPVSTGIASSPTYTGRFQVLSMEDMAYAGQWDLWMPHFIAVYRAGADVYNGIHALPILSSGQRLWEGALGSPASFGCIILGIEEAETLYNWAEIGVLVTIE